MRTLCSFLIPGGVKAIGLYLALAVCVITPSFAASSPDFLKTAHRETVKSTDALPQWDRILSLYWQDQKIYLACAENPDMCPSAAIHQWQRFMTSIQYDSPRRQIEAVNAWFNVLPYKIDKWVYGKSDHWASISEFFEHSGDCEDFAIMKYLTLRQIGFPKESLWIATAYDVYSGTDHAFLMVDLKGETFVLDNRSEVTQASEHSRRYQPHFLFNEKNIWTFETPVMARSARENQNDIVPGNQ